MIMSFLKKSRQKIFKKQNGIGLGPWVPVLAQPCVILGNYLTASFSTCKMGIIIFCRVVMRINKKAYAKHLIQFLEYSSLINSMYYYSLYCSLFLKPQSRRRTSHHIYTKLLTLGWLTNSWYLKSRQIKSCKAVEET